MRFILCGDGFGMFEHLVRDCRGERKEKNEGSAIGL